MKKELELVNKYQDNILDIINHIDDFTTSDLQGAIMAQLILYGREIKNINK